jgi:hypothetical protein
MSDEPKFFKKCKCHHCSLPVSFPSEMLGKTIECPHCQCQTLLTEVKEIEKMVEKPVEKALVPSQVEPSGIVHNLEYIGEVFLSLGFFGMVAAAISAAIMHYKGVDADQTLWMIVVAITSFLPGLFIKNLFFALAEIIRLLRAINAKSNEPVILKPIDSPQILPVNLK